MGQVFEPVIVQGQEGIARIFTLWHGSDNQTCRQLCRNILERMDGTINAAIEQGLFNFLSEQRLATHLQQSAVLNKVARCGDLNQGRDQVGVLGRAAKGRYDTGLHHAALGQGQLRGAGANSDRRLLKHGRKATSEEQ